MSNLIGLMRTPYETFRPLEVLMMINYVRPTCLELWSRPSPLQEVPDQVCEPDIRLGPESFRLTIAADGVEGSFWLAYGILLANGEMRVVIDTDLSLACYIWDTVRLVNVRDITSPLLVLSQQ